ncbi:unnamed protein product [Amoebophrya sp. A25]|nr:unnamed protein product [Amoebophrya sp. A25]|eukprot:GSA25T00010346001.1
MYTNDLVVDGETTSSKVDGETTSSKVDATRKVGSYSRKLNVGGGDGIIKAPSVLGVATDEKV